MGYIEELRNYVGTRPLMLPGALVLLIDQEGRILLQERLDKRWGIPGGLMEMGESFEETARREVLEEAGLVIGALELIDLVSGKDNYVLCPNGDEFYALTAIYLTTDFTGELRIDYTESLDLRFFVLDDVPSNLTRGAIRSLDLYRKRLSGVLPAI